MKKGFTLAELLGVIAILGVIALIAIPTIDHNINESREKLYNAQLEQIIKGAKNYYAEHLDRLPKSGSKSSVTLKLLQDDGYLPYDTDNPKTNKPFSPNLTVEVTNTASSGTSIFEYKVLENTI